ncbi:succinyldiaminopimelate transaminase [Agarilytica rhodophyticola]|uniref:succinyldiaminopimelate transaminase n=1 Tax=Agarilytica rhodophyticola TaxID=1737490 RepID=UPI000B348F4D|nr:succinyldiaminopimelate transaminase [Agarilytica rhodophyticola]
MNPHLEQLQPYPFEKLLKLKQGIAPPADKPHIALSIGEPKHNPPEFVLDEVRDQLHTISNYPVTKGTDELRQAMAHWITHRFGLKQGSIDDQHNIIPVNGTREALFAFTQVVVNAQTPGGKVLMPNPFYQIYEGAALIAGAEPFFINCPEHTNYLPDFANVPEEVWQQCQLLFICTPGNPTGTVLCVEKLCELIALADKYDFIIASDECYSELYFDEAAPPPGLLQACAHLGRDDYQRCVVFHSLSKRSNLPGLRSGFVAGDQAIIKKFLHYRTYHGCAMPVFAQKASIKAWQDEQHVANNRQFYREKFAAVIELLQDSIEVLRPDAGFYLWLKTPIDDQDFARELFAQQNITVLPGTYLARDTQAGNPGKGHVRMALVAPIEECIEAAHRIKAFLQDSVATK